MVKANRKRLDDHNISNIQLTTEERQNQTLAQQPNLISFFDMDRGSSTTGSTTGSTMGGGNSTTGAVQAMASALRNMRDSPLAQTLISQLMMNESDEDTKGVSQEFLDSLDRIPRKHIKTTDECAICVNFYLKDTHPLVVKLPCQGNHHFDLECIGPWLKLNSTCPLCRQDLLAKKVVVEEVEDSEEEWDDTFA